MAGKYIKQANIHTKVFFLLSIIFTFFSEIAAKRDQCVNRLNKYDQDFFYCSKFAIGRGRSLEAWYHAKFTVSQLSQARYRAEAAAKDRVLADITLGVYTH